MKMLDYTVLSIFPTHTSILGNLGGHSEFSDQLPHWPISSPSTSPCKRQQPCRTGTGLRKFLQLHANDREGDYTAEARSNDVSNLQVFSRRLRIHSEHSGKYSLHKRCLEWVDLTLLFSCFQPESLSSQALYTVQLLQRNEIFFIPGY